MAKKVQSKKVNRILSLICIAIFAISLVCVGFFAVEIINQNKQKQDLLRRQEEITQEYNHIRDIYDNNVDDDGYFNVYTDGDMIVYGTGSTIQIS